MGFFFAKKGVINAVKIGAMIIITMRASPIFVFYFIISQTWRLISKETIHEIR